MRHLRLRVLLWTLLVCFLPGCNTVRDMAGTLGELNEVRNAVAKSTGHRDVGVHLQNGQYLTLSFVNSPWNGAGKVEQQAKAREFAKAAFVAMPKRERLSQINVSFVTRRSLVVFHFTNVRGVYAFPVSEFAEPGP